MINTIKGIVVDKSETHIIVMAHNFGISLAVAQPASFLLEEEIFLHTYMHWNQEQGPSLFGFLSLVEKELFLLIISCSGIGPRLGIALLSQLTVTQIVHAIQVGDHKVLSSVSGIGAKKAEYIVLHLKDKMSGLTKNIASSDTVSGAKVAEWNTIIEVLQSLNYSKQEIDAAVSHLQKEYKDTSYTFDQLMRSGLSFLAKRV